MDLQSNILSVLSKNSVADAAKIIASQVLNEEINGLEVYEFFKFIENLKDEIKSNKTVTEFLCDIISKESDKVFITKFGTKATIHNHPTYDFSHDPIWVEIKEKESDISKARKEREAVLKLSRPPDKISNYPGRGEVNPATGEIFLVLPPKKTISESIKITLR